MANRSALAASTFVALALTFPPVLARADSEDFGKILTGLAVFGLLATALDNIDHDAETDIVKTRRPPHGHHGFRNRHRPSSKAQALNGRILRRNPTGHHDYRSAPLPDRCRRIVHSGRGHRAVYSATCLDRKYRHASRLPEWCERIVRTARKDLIVYGARCLARENWRVRLR
ncbi:MAG: hypothetical protein F4186_03850 [Boseongicola sp. SB0676_bin_33]|uniref:Uncharacterized protein n=1 Tax=Boseongicola sp. SB0664_bin_43 TaxID=2604844 RepID=A0A6B0XY80_9RHOB|nr:hypothetical protein [Boseongicola sp. SB0664_bin_43]MYF88562.1 hypothetical protein [Boseongicola sp. SB0676_bin_33]MYK30434.1 hypothetical protein [Boseongicola sp. SB0670_bin_30]